jgi:hypothetical protein
MIIIREYLNFSVIRQKLDFNNESHVTSPKDVIRGQKKFAKPCFKRWPKILLMFNRNTYQNKYYSDIFKKSSLVKVHLHEAIFVATIYCMV